MINTLLRLGHSTALADRMRVGTLVGALLAVMTLIEYAVAVVPIEPRVVWLVVIALVKTWLILDFFMHVRQLRSEG